MKIKAIIIALIVVVIIAAAVVLLTKNRGQSPVEVTGQSTAEAQNLKAKKFSNWEEFFASGLLEKNDRRKLIFVGVDGADWTIVDPMIEKGVLPNFKKMKERGCYGFLRSTTCFISPPAWVAMMTGCRPPCSGVYTFGNWDEERQKFFPVRSQDVKVPSVWDIATLAGKRSAIVNVPVTYPVHEVNGVMISGMMTPSSLREYVSYVLDFKPLSRPDYQSQSIQAASPIRKADLLFHGNRFEVYLYDSRNGGGELHDMARVLLEPVPIDDNVMNKPQVYDIPVDSFSPWIKLMVQNENTGEFNKGWARVKILHSPDAKHPYLARFSHFLFAVGDTDVDFVYPDSLADVLKKNLRYYFPSKFLDRDIVPASARESAEAGLFLYQYDKWDLFMFVFTQTDNIQHVEGDSEYTQRVYREIDRFLGEMMDRLPENAVIVVASDHGFKKYTYSINLNPYFKKLNLLEYKADKTIDFDRTLVFNNMWQLYFNHKLLSKEELAKRGIEAPGNLSAEEALKHHLIEVGRNFTVEDGTRIPLEFVPLEPTGGSDAPDMVTPGDYGEYVLEFWNFRHPSGNITTTLESTEQWEHRRKGIYIAWGNGIRHGGETADAEIVDLAPTMLYLLGLPVSPHIDGQVMSQILESDMIARAPLYAVDDYAKFFDNTRISTEEMESMEKKLKSLGYIR